MISQEKTFLKITKNYKNRKLINKNKIKIFKIKIKIVLDNFLSNNKQLNNKINSILKKIIHYKDNKIKL